MWRLLRKLGGVDVKSEAKQALERAESEVVTAGRREAELQRVTERIREHGRRNHFGERIEAAIRRA